MSCIQYPNQHVAHVRPLPVSLCLPCINSRVAVTRTLKLGSSLKRRDDGSYELDLSQPGAHKTSAVFGPTKTTLSASIAPWLDDYIETFSLSVGCYLFHAKGNPLEVMKPSNWTYTVKSVFEKHGKRRQERGSEVYRRRSLYTREGACWRRSGVQRRSRRVERGLGNEERKQDRSKSRGARIKSRLCWL